MLISSSTPTPYLSLASNLIFFESDSIHTYGFRPLSDVSRTEKHTDVTRVKVILLSKIWKDKKVYKYYVISFIPDYTKYENEAEVSFVQVQSGGFRYKLFVI